MRPQRPTPAQLKGDIAQMEELIQSREKELCVHHMEYSLTRIQREKARLDELYAELRKMKAKAKKI